MGAWRSIANVLLWLSIAASALGVLIGSISFFNDENYGAGFAVLFGGAVVIIVSHTIFGLFVELCCNIAALKAKHCDGVNIGKAKSRRGWICGFCGNVNELEATFCTNCGQRSTQTEEIQ